jgi:hypothetical protein
MLRHHRRDLTVKARYPLKMLAGGVANVRNVKEKRGLSGYGQLRVNLPAFNKAAETGCPFVVLTDFDVHVRCPGQLLAFWLSGVCPSSNLLFRVAVKEVEAWLLADVTNMADFLAVDAAKIPLPIETIPDPKVEIVELARGSRSPEIVADLVPRAGSTAEVGRYFERSLMGFVRDVWDIDKAAHNSPSLLRALRAIDQL